MGTKEDSVDHGRDKESDDSSDNDSDNTQGYETPTTIQRQVSFSPTTRGAVLPRRSSERLVGSSPRLRGALKNLHTSYNLTMGAVIFE